MAWDGTATWQIFKDFFILTLPDFDADAEDSGVFDLRDYLTFIPSHYSLLIVRAPGLVTVIDASLEGLDHLSTSAFAIATVINTTATTGFAGSTTDYTSATGKLSEHLFTHIRLTVTTVGAGNTLKAIIIGRR